MYPNISYLNPFPGNIIVILLILVVWSFGWKGYALWTCAKNNHKEWFVTLLILNTLGILEMVYIFNVAKKTWADVKKDFSRALS